MTDLKSIGRNVTIFPEAQIIYPENVSIGTESMIDGHCFLYAAGDGIEIGKFCHVTVGSHLQSGGLLKMEDFSACGAQCIIMAASDNYLGEGFIGLKVFGDKYRKMDNRPVTLKRHAHVGAGTIILPGVTIGEGCSVGAGSLVTRDLPPWTICVGSPARPVKDKPKEKQLRMEKEFLAEYEGRRQRKSVSICCLTYNHEDFIREALDSFLMQQTDFDFEVLVHDDASTDRTPEILREYAARYPDIIKPIFQTENQFSKDGVYPIAKYVYPLAKGKYIAECDGDDYWTDPLKLQKQVDYLEANPEFVLTYHSFEIRGNGHVVPCSTNPRDYSQEELLAIPLGDYQIATSTKVFRNIYGPETKTDFENFCGDYPLTVLMGLHGKCKFIEGIGPSVYRKHAHNSWGGLPSEEMAKRTKAMHRKLYDLMVEKGNPRHIALRKRFL